MGTLLLAKQKDIGNKLCFRLIDEKILEENKVCVKIHWFFFSVHEIDCPSNISMNRTVEHFT